LDLPDRRQQGDYFTDFARPTELSVVEVRASFRSIGLTGLGILEAVRTLASP
jgi:hypothetical protein